ncbi:beta-ketoacyl synthase N-terminal-like domain-containing protein [Actinomadura macrotermitis]|uniref:Beta-ketoacyl synthase-like N-terminal domain-containing protein n=1 Tax=Actinomadura macrotermitis TaxID=2585200 RepID=A0A7K0C3A4_9ACTN|nr:beta-ketoacyl synthase N-terminal-like domain-containing protein [Actinomadura macrotermitis]MQY07903.1 hypothetical protein [Actinomadura macrotermitis]
MMDITGWSAVSPYGVGAASFAAGVRSRRPAAAEPDPAGVPGAEVCRVPGFDPRTALGGKGTRAMNRVTGLAVTAVGALAAARPEPDAALVLGTTSGSVQSMMDFTRASLTGERPFDVEPSAVPGAVMNCAAGFSAIRYGLTGPNTTIAGGRAAGLLGLAYARRLLAAGRAATVLCGAAEECSAARSWLEHHARSGAPARLGEGAGVLRLEPPGAPGALARVLAVHSALDTGVAEVRRRALAAAGVPAAAEVPDVAALIGDTGAVSAVFQIAAALATGGGTSGRTVVVTAADPAGMTAAAVLELRPGHRPGEHDHHGRLVGAP